MEQISEAALIGAQSAMINQKQISHEHNTRMSNQRVVIAALDFLGKAQELFNHLEELNHPQMAFDLSGSNS